MDDFTNALLKTTVLDDFCNLVWKYGGNTAKVLESGDDAILFVQKYKNATCNRMFLYRQCYWNI